MYESSWVQLPTGSWSWMEYFTVWDNTEDFMADRQILSPEFPTMVFSYDKL